MQCCSVRVRLWDCESECMTNAELTEAAACRLARFQYIPTHHCSPHHHHHFSLLSSLSFWIWSSSDRYRAAALLWRAQYIPIHHICPQHFPFLPHLMDNGLLCTGCSTRIHLSAHPSLHSFQPLWSSWQMHESLLPVRVCPEQRDWTRLARQLWVFLRTVMSSRRWLRSRFSHR